MPDQEHQAREGRELFATASTSELTAGTSPSSWTSFIPPTDHNSLFLNTDYGATSLGPISDWGPALRLYTSLVFSDSRPACVYWGRRKVAFYNEGFGVCCGGVALMGQAFEDAFPSLWPHMSPVFDQAAATGKTVDVDNILLFPTRNGYVEETYFVGQFIPLRSDDFRIEGFYNTVYETTARVLHERRRIVVDLIAAISALTVDETLSSIMDALRKNPHDITMAMLYSFDDVQDNQASLRLRGSIGVQKGQFPFEDQLETSNTGLVPFFRQVQSSGKPLLLSEGDGSLPTSLFNRVEWCGYGEPSRHVVIVPLMTNGSLLGFYVQGTNPRRAYDEATEMSIIDMTRQMESKWSMSITTEQAKKREQSLERRAMEIESRLKLMATSAPIGMCQVTLDSKIQWANDQYYEITGQDRSYEDADGFRACIVPEDREGAMDGLRSLLEGAPLIVREYQLVRKWKPPIEIEDHNAEEQSAWILTSSFPVMENGKVKMIMGYLTDISHQKWAESTQKRIAENAVEAKLRLDQFIDFVSHEIRNPLSAITQLADGIAQSGKAIPAGTEDALRTVEENADSAATILALTTIQRRIIDDVLILSRLESKMLSITPIIERPWKIVRDTVAMFRGEARLHSIQFEVIRDDSYNMNDIEYVYMDTSRLAQILINLISNAIKFTTSRSVRKITVSYGAQASRQPQISTAFGNVEYIMPVEQEHFDVPLRPLREGEEPLYLYFCVQDTGMGLSRTERSRLFKRFSQASAKTHIAYGGSGLGLYICRQLADRQGGRVGVASHRGEGSAFGFYIETRHAVSPERKPDTGKQALPPSITATAPKSVAVPLRAASNVDQKVCISEEGSRPHGVSILQPEPGSVSQQPKYHILLVEDNLVNQKVLAKQLRTAKCTVTIANHGQEALEKLTETDCWRDFGAETARSGNQREPTRVDVVLMDLEMPILGGLDCSRRIRVLESEGRITRHLPIIATTANARQEQQDMALDAGMNRVLSKPFLLGELMECIQDVLEMAHAAG